MSVPMAARCTAVLFQGQLKVFLKQLLIEFAKSVMAVIATPLECKKAVANAMSQRTESSNAN